MSPRTLFDRELESLKEDVSFMGEKIVRVYVELFQALEMKDREAMKQIIERDRDINDLQKNIEVKCLTLLTRQQPVARDLRQISAALKAVTDIERIGDNVSDMAELFLRMDMPCLTEFSEGLPSMVEETKQMVCDSMAAFAEGNMSLAKEVIEHDDIVDNLFNVVKEDLIEDLKEGEENPDVCIDMLMIAKYLEKIADHAVNTCEWEVFRETGEIQDSKLQ